MGPEPGAQKETLLLFRTQYLGGHVPGLGELVHVLPELHLLLDGLDVGGEAAEAHPQVRRHLEGLGEVASHGGQLLSETEVGRDRHALVALHGHAGAAVV